jgi:UDP-2,3-diacylglucosamine hydrolase
MFTLFISDLHLCDERPDKFQLFKNLLHGPAHKAEALYILGDLFEAWAGDDDRTPLHIEVISELFDYTNTGGKLFLMRGNRDFLIGDEFARNTGATIITDPTIIYLYGNKILLMHGDTLCTRDVKYQIYRRIVNNNFAIYLFLLVPYALRKRIWHRLRTVASNTTTRRSPCIVDVHQPAVEDTMRHYTVKILIHGHTHLQGVHEFSLDEKIVQRFVLGDWYMNDSVLVANEESMRLMRVKECINGNW